MQSLQGSLFPPTKTSNTNVAEFSRENARGAVKKFTDTSEPSHPLLKHKSKNTQQSKTTHEYLLKPISEQTPNFALRYAVLASFEF